MYFWRRFLYVPCFIIFSQAGLDLGNNEINAVSKTLALGNEGNTRGMRVTSPHAELPRGHRGILHNCFLRLRCWRRSAWPQLTDTFKVLKFQNPKSFLCGYNLQVFRGKWTFSYEIHFRVWKLKKYFLKYGLLRSFCGSDEGDNSR